MARILGFFSEKTTDTGTDLTTKGDMHGYSDENTRIPVGTNNQSLLAASGEALGLKWGASSTSTLTSAGDLLYASGANTLARLARGSDNQVLKMNGTSLNWETLSDSGANTALSNLSSPSVNTGIDMNTQHLLNIKFLGFATNTSVTLSSGGDADFATAGMRFLMRVDTYNNDSSDSWASNTATGATNRWSTFSCVAQTRVVTVTDNTANIIAGNFTLNHPSDRIHGVWNSGAAWVELGRADNDE